MAATPKPPRRRNLEWEISLAAAATGVAKPRLRTAEYAAKAGKVKPHHVDEEKLAMLLQDRSRRKEV